MAVVVEAIIIVTIIVLTHFLLVLDSNAFMNNGNKYNWCGQCLGWKLDCGADFKRGKCPSYKINPIGSKYRPDYSETTKTTTQYSQNTTTIAAVKKL